MIEIKNSLRKTSRDFGMSDQRKKKSGLWKSSVPLILVGTGLITLSIAVVILVPPKNATINNPGVAPAPRAVNFTAPELELVDLSDAPVSLQGLQGQVVLVNNWATWCPPCRAEMPELEAYYRTHKDDGFVLIGINSGDPKDQVLDFIQKNGLTFPIWLDPKGSALRAFQNNTLPSTYVIDKSGSTRFIWMGVVNSEVLEAYVTPLLKE